LESAKLSRTAIEHLLNDDLLSQFVCGSEGSLNMYSSRPTLGDFCLFTWTGTTGADLRFWDMHYEYFHRAMPQEGVRPPPPNLSFDMYRSFRNRHICTALGVQTAIDIPDARTTSINDIAAMFARVPNHVHKVQHPDIEAMDSLGVRIFKPYDRMNWPYRISASNTFLAYMSYDVKNSCSDLTELVDHVRCQSYHVTEKLDWALEDDSTPLLQPPSPPQTPMPARVSELAGRRHHPELEDPVYINEYNLASRFGGVYLYTLPNSHPDFSRLFPLAPPGTHAIAVARKILLRDRAAHWNGKRFYDLGTQMSFSPPARGIPGDDQPLLSQYVAHLRAYWEKGTKQFNDLDTQMSSSPEPAREIQKDDQTVLAQDMSQLHISQGGSQ